MNAVARNDGAPVNACGERTATGLARAGATLAALLTAAAMPALAGRPMATDDASTAEAGRCQIEAWGEKSSADKAWVLAPACGLGPGVELGAELLRHQPAQALRRSAVASLKLVPEAWQWDSGIGTLALGLKAALSHERPRDAGWRRSGAQLLGLASLSWGERWTLHGNLGAQRDSASGRNGALAYLALAYQAGERTQLFAEVLGNTRTAVFGPAQRQLGALWWLRPETLGLSLTAGRASATQWSAGIGCYGLGW